MATEDGKATVGKHFRQGTRRERSCRPLGDATGEIGAEYLIAICRVGPEACRVDGVLGIVRRDGTGAETSVLAILVLDVDVAGSIDCAGDPRDEGVVGRKGDRSGEDRGGGWGLGCRRLGG
ncbi:MAG: hypothetical protein OXI33_03655 [Chloroflexota bacterium]|nr:hypothetical protein [Chloroflexota bacterium]